MNNILGRMNPNKRMRFRKRGNAWLSPTDPAFLIVQIGSDFMVFRQDEFRSGVRHGAFYDETWVNGAFHTLKEAITYAYEQYSWHRPRT